MNELKMEIGNIRDWINRSLENDPSFCAQYTAYYKGNFIEEGSFGMLPERRNPLFGKADRVNPLTLFDVGIFTRTFSFYALNNILRENKLTISAPLYEFLPTFNDPRPILDEPVRLVDTRKLTLQHLIRHTSGLPETVLVERTDDVESITQKVVTTPFEMQPDRITRRSAVGYTLIGFILETMTGKPLSKVFDETIFADIGLRDTGFRPIMRCSKAILPIPDEGIAPTFEGENGRRKMRLGFTGDPLCACLGGESGDNGLFSTACEIAAFGHHFVQKVLRRAFDESELFALLHPLLGEPGKTWNVYLSHTGCIFLLNWTNETIFVILTNGGLTAERSFFESWRKLAAETSSVDPLF